MGGEEQGNTIPRARCTEICKGYYQIGDEIVSFDEDDVPRHTLESITEDNNSIHGKKSLSLATKTKLRTRQIRKVVEEQMKKGSSKSRRRITPLLTGTSFTADDDEEEREEVPKRFLTKIDSKRKLSTILLGIKEESWYLAKNHELEASTSTQVMNCVFFDEKIWYNEETAIETQKIDTIDKSMEKNCVCENSLIIEASENTSNVIRKESGEFSSKRIVNDSMMDQDCTNLEQEELNIHNPISWDI